MDTQTILILFCIGIVAGMLSGIVGIGGGIIIVPALVFFLGFSQLKAQGTSLGILLLPVGILAVIQFYKQGYIDMKTVGIVACSFVVGGYLGSKIALALPQESVKKVFAVLLLLISIKMFFFDKQKTASVKINSVTEKPV
ncbi:MAG: sulfite exporter TauE/SafE family protein [Chitinophagaceae bacterium]|nr:sulfite exporter TauE/SafE family protein [Chitinophagaceae bacterium]